ncbi:MAG: calcium-binding protein [Hyphomicrobiaceae bacterium]|nr:calcium-binding protein [Hyphomicrobiaceae bacterium]
MATRRGTNLRDSLNGTNAADRIFGLGNNDTLTGLGGNDILDGGTGADRMIGGLGNDTYFVDNTGDRVVESANQGIDLVKSRISFTLPANFEQVQLIGTAEIDATGNGLDNVLTGNGGENVLLGLDGNDVLVGGGGSDILNGGEGNDTLIPGPGNGVADTILGGNGFDTVDYRDAAGPVQVWLAQNVFALHAANDFVSLVESVTGSRFNDSLIASTTDFSNAFGGGGNDRIVGSSATYDRLRGDDGNDTLVGATGEEDFWLQYDRGFDFVINYRQNGQDHVFIVGSEFGLGTNPGNFISTAEFGSSDPQGVPTFSGIQKLFYVTSTGQLWGDKDGVGASFEPVLIAVFAQGSAAPTAADIFVV